MPGKEILFGFYIFMFYVFILMHFYLFNIKIEQLKIDLSGCKHIFDENLKENFFTKKYFQIFRKTFTMKIVQEINKSIWLDNEAKY